MRKLLLSVSIGTMFAVVLVWSLGRSSPVALAYPPKDGQDKKDCVLCATTGEGEGGYESICVITNHGGTRCRFIHNRNDDGTWDLPYCMTDGYCSHGPAPSPDPAPDGHPL